MPYVSMRLISNFSVIIEKFQRSDLIIMNIVVEQQL